jgi:hypothetical protein
MWVICAHEAIRQSLELAFQTIFAIMSRHRGSEESGDAWSMLCGVNFEDR